MQFVQASVNLETQPADFDGMMKHIELCGRVSYKSEDKINEESCQKFLKMLIKRGHTSTCEHGTVYLTVPNTDEFKSEIELLTKLKYTDVVSDDGHIYITTNYRVVLQNNISLDLVGKFWSNPTKHICRVTIRVVCSRGVGYELVRHRVLSFTQESTRYCNYSKDKHGGCIKYIIPSWIDDIENGETFTVEDVSPEKVIKNILEQKRSAKTMILVSNHVCAEQAYMELLNLKCTPQEARDVLPNGLKTELVITGSIPQWEYFLSLRSPVCGAKGVHPDAAVIGDYIYYTLVSAGHIKERKPND